FIEGPEVSLKGSPTVSPVTDALCGSEPLYSITPLMSTPFSKDFFALSHAPPALFWNIPINTPETVTPASNPPRTSAELVSANTSLKPNPTSTGVTMAMAPGRSISLKEAFVDISTHLSYSGFALYSMIPGISLNCLLTSCTMSIAALPTAAIANDENMKGIMAPTNKAA